MRLPTGVMPTALALSAALVAGQAPSQLSVSEIETAIEVGAAKLGNEIGASVHEGNPFSAWSQIGFGLTIHTPTTWIQYLASRSAFDGRPLAAADISDEDRTRFLRVFVRPAFQIRHVALILPGSRLPRPPIGSAPCLHLISFSAPGPDSMDQACTEYRFDWNEVLERTENGRREFEVAVTAIVPTAGGTREIHKNFKVDRDDLAKLVW